MVAPPPGKTTVGARFIIDKDGKITQTMRLTRKCEHVGKMYSRCYQIHLCVLEEEKRLSAMDRSLGLALMTKYTFSNEIRKSDPDRYPANSESIGIEIVSKSLGEKDVNPSQDFEKPTEAQQRSIQWLVQGLLASLKLKRTDVYRHGEIAVKFKGEARYADWEGSTPAERGGTKQ